MHQPKVEFKSKTILLFLGLPLINFEARPHTVADMGCCALGLKAYGFIDFNQNQKVL